MRYLSPLLLILLITACTAPTKYEITGVLRQHHKLTLTFDGPELSETSEENPFRDVQLRVNFEQGDQVFEVPGYYAADGNAGETSATGGNKWRVHFNPPTAGAWTFTAFFRKGENIALSANLTEGEALDGNLTHGRIIVEASDKKGRDFRAKGRITISENGRFFQHLNGDYFLKGGADSPENFLAYHEFDGTYRHLAEAREGEADPTESLHRYEPHLDDWQEGDPSWQGDKGKGIIGALNYLAGQGMNSVYFLVMNIGGDGKDVWPYIDHETFDRFDCSKLDQWELVFEYMEELGLMMHLVTQETENERLLDGGDTGPQRQLFYRELIARFGHHNALVWNLGEENGPASFSPDGQTSGQQRAMATNLKAQDPYDHPVVIHTHSWRGQKDEGLPALLGHEPLDGLSFQVDRRSDVHSEILKWSAKAQESGHPWLIAMDEIGMWYEGVKPDAIDPGHDSLRQEVLWGSLMAGAAGVEWYFGANYAHNDLTMEDWRSRANIWTQTRHALDFFNQYLSYWEMKNCDDLLPTEGAYGLAKDTETYALFFPKGTTIWRFRSEKDLTYQVQWYNPRKGGDLRVGRVPEVTGQGWQDLGGPPEAVTEDWVILLSQKQ
ncbi:MAG TPA: DUF5060 domain-containing protein [Saprospiraceae bacterium]|nr:DUF5060 domain-containing protein [Saprospiraceae bacterium]